MPAMKFISGIASILEQTAPDSPIRSLAIDILIQNPSKEINNEFRSARAALVKSVKKEFYKCNHEGCQTKTCYSHELSESIFLKPLSNNNHNVNILNFDLTNNAANYHFKSVNISNALNFPGYCSAHDASLFETIESKFSGINNNFINIQCLRTLKRNIFELSRAINLLEQLIESLREIVTAKPENLFLTDKIQSLEDKKLINSQRLARANHLYFEINSAIKLGKFPIKFLGYDEVRVGYCFSGMFDLTIETDESPVMFFVLKLEHQDFCKLIICYHYSLENSQALSEINPKNLKGAINLTQLMLSLKERFAFSDAFINKLSEAEKRVFTRDASIYEPNPFQSLIATKLLFTPPG